MKLTAEDKKRLRNNLAALFLVCILYYLITPFYRMSHPLFPGDFLSRLRHHPGLDPRSAPGFGRRLCLPSPVLDGSADRGGFRF